MIRMSGEGRITDDQESRTATLRRMVSGTFSSRKQRDSADSAVQDMVGEGSSSEAQAAGHGGSSTETVAILSKKLTIPFLCREAASG